jgi:methylenetetrahydrofolate dehydrogenase (NADP+)/methenyltetrahydrofolate cyclohydrolase
MTEQILGSKILKSVKERCEAYREFFVGKLVTIILFDPPKTETNLQTLSQYEAAVTSTNQKVKTFEFLGCKVNSVKLPGENSQNAFINAIRSAVTNQNSWGIIVQNPIPQEGWKRVLKEIPAQLDIDGLSENHPIFKASATSEAIARLVQDFCTPETKVAVVGALGFVGKGVVRILEDKNIECIKLDRQDNLLRTHEADIIVSAAGRADLLDERHILPSHRLVVDSAFIPQSDGSVKGDVSRSAYDTPQFLTPVPGGVGPLQMAVLLERIVELHLEQKLEKWSIPVPEIEPLVLTAEELIVEAIETDIDLEP